MSKYQNAATFTKFSPALFSICLLLLTGCQRDANLIKPDDGLPPAVPVNLQIYYSAEGEIGIVWQPNSEPDLRGYNVYRKIGSSSIYNFLAFTTNDYFVDDSLLYNEVYYYKISAIDLRGRESNLSTEVFATPNNFKPPTAPRNVLINARNWEGKSSVYLSWDRNPESDVAHYNIYRSTQQNFTADSTNLVGETINSEFSDTTNLQFYTTYYYSVRAVDRGNLTSAPSETVRDEIYEISQPIFPADNSNLSPFNSFKILTIKKSVTYQIIVQTNQFFGDFWSTTFSSNVISDTISVKFNPVYLDYNVTYYWRVITYSPGGYSPNSISQQYKFTIKQ